MLTPTPSLKPKSAYTYQGTNAFHYSSSKVKSVNYPENGLLSFWGSFFCYFFWTSKKSNKFKRG